MKTKSILLLCVLILAVLNVAIFILNFSGNSDSIVSVRKRTKEYLAEITFGNKCNQESASNRPGSIMQRLTYTSPSLNVSCAKLFNGDLIEAKRVRELQQQWTNSISDVEFLETISNCKNIVSTFSDNNFYNSYKEKQFPLAFVMVISYQENSIQQYTRLLRFIYRPQNVYCLHVDHKSPKIWVRYINNFASCFPNVIVSRDSVDVIYASGKILTAHLNCLKELLLIRLPWKYAIDLHGTELPLVTNRNIVEALSQLNGVNAIVNGNNMSQVLQKDPHSITARKMTYRADFIQGKGMQLTTNALGPVPYNMTLYKSADSPNSAFSRAFVQFALIDKRAIALAIYLQDVLSAVEFFFNTLNNLEDAPGGTMESIKIIRKGIPIPIIANRNWQSSKNGLLYHCHFYIHRICILSVGDLHWLNQLPRKHSVGPFFMNKYLMIYDHVIMDCMEEYLLHQNYQEYFRDCQGIQ